MPYVLTRPRSYRVPWVGLGGDSFQSKTKIKLLEMGLHLFIYKGRINMIRHNDIDVGVC